MGVESSSSGVLSPTELPPLATLGVTDTDTDSGSGSGSGSVRECGGV